MDHHRISARLHALDGLRAIAASLVVLHHLGVSGIASMLVNQGQPVLGRLLGSFTASGVELFFVLSGVVLLRPYLRDGRAMDIPKYFRRRAIRLYPPFFMAWLLSGLSVWLVWQFPTWWSHISALPHFNLTAWISQISIIHLGAGAYNFAWWSLTIEVGFYLLAPGIVLFVNSFKFPERIMAWLFVISIAISTVVYWISTLLPEILVVDEIRVFNIYLSSFGAGIFLAKSDLPQRYQPIIVFIGLCIVLAGSFLEWINIHVGWSLVYFSVVAAAIDTDSSIARFLSSDALIWLGERSYSLFLTHYSVIAISCHLVSMFVTGKGVVYFVASRAIASVVSIIVASVLFHMVEKRFAHNLMTADRLFPWKRV